MDSSTQLLFKQLEKEKSEILNKVVNWSSDEMFAKPSDDAWSAAQVFDHLFIAEHGTLLYLKKKSLGILDLPDANTKNQMNFQRLNLALKSAEKFKLPPSMPNPSNNELSVTLASWDKTRQGFIDLYESLPDLAKTKEVFKHPYAGYLTPHQTLCFLRDHIEHHKRQIDNLNKIIR